MNPLGFEKEHHGAKDTLQPLRVCRIVPVPSFDLFLSPEKDVAVFQIAFAENGIEVGLGVGVGAKTQDRSTKSHSWRF